MSQRDVVVPGSSAASLEVIRGFRFAKSTESEEANKVRTLLAGPRASMSNLGN